MFGLGLFHICYRESGMAHARLRFVFVIHPPMPILLRLGVAFTTLLTGPAVPILLTRPQANESIMKYSKYLPVLFVTLILTSACAEQQSAEHLVASKEKSDMTYKQLMVVMGSSFGTLQEGILRENKQMVMVGAEFIQHHPAPKHKPWIIMREEDQQDFKKTLLAYDQILHDHADKLVEAAQKENWVEAGNASNDLMSACITCHAMWRNKVK